jgi:sugar phosphate isomerase/epimerase
MTAITRRDWNKLALTGLLGAALPATAWGFGRSPGRPGGVELGVQTYSFRDRSLDEAIEAMRTIGLTSCELWSAHLEPSELRRRVMAREPGAMDELRKWRVTTPLDEFRAVRQKLDQAGIRLNAFNHSFRADMTDEEIDRGFEIAKALDAPVITSSSTRPAVERFLPFARRHGMKVGLHNHSNIRPEEYATPQDWHEVVELAAKAPLAINLDIGHYTAAGFDPVATLRRHHQHIVALHIKDRKTDQGPNVAFGEGDTPIREVLLLLRDQQWAIPANIEYEYKGEDTVEEVRRCFDYCRRILES